MRSYLKKAVLAFMVSGSALAASGSAARAEDAWSFPVLVNDKLRGSAAEPFQGKPVDYKALPKSEVTKKWNLCLLVPHTTNDIIRAYLYGTVEETKRLGASLTVFDAGGYTNTDKQLAQFDDCVTLGANAILLMATTPDGFNQKIAEARAKGIKVIDVNIGINGPADGRVVVTYEAVGKILGKTLGAQNAAGAASASTVILPGPAGVNWAETTVTGFKEAAKDSSIKVEKVVYGGSSKMEQLPLVEDTLTTFGNLKYLVGMGTSIEAALNVLREQGRVGEIGLYASFITPDLMKSIEKGDVKGAVVENSIIINKLVVDMAVRLLEGKATILDAVPSVTLVSKDNLADVPASNFAPSDWKATFKVD